LKFWFESRLRLGLRLGLSVKTNKKCQGGILCDKKWKINSMYRRDSKNNKFFKKNVRDLNDQGRTSKF